MSEVYYEKLLATLSFDSINHQPIGIYAKKQLCLSFSNINPRHCRYTCYQSFNIIFFISESRLRNIY